MPNPSTIILKNARYVVEYGGEPAFPKSTYYNAINKRAAEIRRAGETVEKAFTRCIVDDDVGRTLYKASKQADGPEIEGDAVQDFVAAPPTKGPAHDAMQRLADSHNRKFPDKSPAQSYASVYSDPANSELRQRVIAEHLSPRLARDARDHQQRESDDFADRQASARGERDIKGPRVSGVPNPHPGNEESDDDGGVEKRFVLFRR